MILQFSVKETVGSCETFQMPSQGEWVSKQMNSSDSLEESVLMTRSLAVFWGVSSRSGDLALMETFCHLLLWDCHLPFVLHVSDVDEVEVWSATSFRKSNSFSELIHCFMWLMDITLLFLDWVILQVMVRRDLRNISKALDMMTGTAVAIRPTSVSFCIIFLTRPGGKRTLNFLFCPGILNT